MSMRALVALVEPKIDPTLALWLTHEWRPLAARYSRHPSRRDSCLTPQQRLRHCSPHFTALDAEQGHAHGPLSSV